MIRTTLITVWLCCMAGLIVGELFYDGSGGMGMLIGGALGGIASVVDVVRR